MHPDRFHCAGIRAAAERPLGTENTTRLLSRYANMVYNLKIIIVYGVVNREFKKYPNKDSITDNEIERISQITKLSQSK